MLLIHNLINRHFPDSSNGINDNLRNFLALINSVPFGMPMMFSSPLLTVHRIILHVDEYTVMQGDAVTDMLNAVDSVVDFNRFIMDGLDVLCLT